LNDIICENNYIKYNPRYDKILKLTEELDVQKDFSRKISIDR